VKLRRGITSCTSVPAICQLFAIGPANCVLRTARRSPRWLLSMMLAISIKEDL
jgi:hypothetical protein